MTPNSGSNSIVFVQYKSISNKNIKLKYKVKYIAFIYKDSAILFSYWLDNDNCSVIRWLASLSVALLLTSFQKSQEFGIHFEIMSMTRLCSKAFVGVKKSGQDFLSSKSFLCQF